VKKSIPQLSGNPLGTRICRIFSHDGIHLDFVDYLEMIAAFSRKADRQTKLDIAFLLYGRTVLCWLCDCGSACLVLAELILAAVCMSWFVGLSMSLDMSMCMLAVYVGCVCWLCVSVRLLVRR
jgi:hypothetical protein